MSVSRTCARVLLWLAAAILIGGAAMHAAAFGRVNAAVAAAHDLPPFFGRSLQALWLADSATLSVLGLVSAALALQPARLNGALLMLLICIPAATAICLYGFIGSFLPAHVLIAACLLTLAAAALLRRGSEELIAG